MASSHTTGGDPVDGADPGGTRSTKPPRKHEHSVVSGDRNGRVESKIADDERPPDTAANKARKGES